MKKKVAVYSGTRNVYKLMLPAVTSLVQNSSVEEVFFLIEDDVFPYKLPTQVRCINISDQQWFPRDGPNFNNPWTYMTLVRAALPKMFPDLDRILSLDIDTIVDQNIDAIWDLPIENMYLAASRELHKTHGIFLYTNTGVALYNLKKLREDGKDNEVIRALNTKKYDFNEQDAMNQLCQGYIYDMSSEYNVTLFTEVPKQVKIVHYAAFKNWEEQSHYMKYKKIYEDTYGEIHE